MRVPNLLNATVVLAFAFLASGCSHVSYLVQAGLGQLSLYSHERPLQEVVDDPRTTSAVRDHLKWVPEIKKMVESELGVKPTGNYTTYVALDRPYVIWSVTAAEAFEVRLVHWSFPFFGAFPYLGFFSESGARGWAGDYQGRGFDTYVRGVGAYSTLGYLRDPLLSSMLTRSKGDMVDLIFHESTHGQIYIKGQVDFNEQIASYIGNAGERQWIVRTLGAGSKELVEWEGERANRRRFGVLLKQFADELKLYYASSGALGGDERRAGKEQRFAAFRKTLETEPWQGRGMSRVAKLMTNNAALLAFLTYEDEQALFDLLNEKCGGHLKDALRYLKSFEREWDDLKSNNPPSKPQQILKERLLNTSGSVCLYPNRH